ncbi:MAG: polyprenyl synthetase family protein, partial [Armatimonadetes bacterium]|nr:polyprenyl synthetase family protein [Armatimonadota bacterium]
MSAHAIRSNSSQGAVYPEWAAPIAKRLDEVRHIIESVTFSTIDVVSQISSHAFSAGGKCIRPALVILSAGACGAGTDMPAVVKIAAVVELLHTASLLHDDVVDSADVRRGVSTTNSIWGNTLSVLAGDFLLSKAFSLLVDGACPS